MNTANYVCLWVYAFKKKKKKMQMLLFANNLHAIIRSLEVQVGTI